MNRSLGPNLYAASIDHERLASQRTVDLTTIGRQSGRPRRLEIWWFRFENRFIITGTPGRRDWLANIRANPAVIIHTRIGELAGTAQEVLDVAFRRRFFASKDTRWYSTQSGLESLVAEAPMVEIVLDPPPVAPRVDAF
ncbi:MAG TPA: nitroreductase/quinone reductase family protein [Acidimicrobiia bacterium]|nr:nitroreductase/quinone reductase family protein [Acidimicrobiia bacterium]